MVVDPTSIAMPRGEVGEAREDRDDGRRRRRRDGSAQRRRSRCARRRRSRRVAPAARSARRGRPPTRVLVVQRPPELSDHAGAVGGPSSTYASVNSGSTTRSARSTSLRTTGRWTWLVAGTSMTASPTTRRGAAEPGTGFERAGEPGVALGRAGRRPRVLAASIAHFANVPVVGPHLAVATDGPAPAHGVEVGTERPGRVEHRGAGARSADPSSPGREERATARPSGPARRGGLAHAKPPLSDSATRRAFGYSASNRAATASAAACSGGGGHRAGVRLGRPAPLGHVVGGLGQAGGHRGLVDRTLEPAGEHRPGSGCGPTARSPGSGCRATRSSPAARPRHATPACTAAAKGARPTGTCANSSPSTAAACVRTGDRRRGRRTVTAARGRR